MIILGNPQYFTTLLKNNLATSSTMQCIEVGMKVAYLENQSTTTMMEPNPSDIGNTEMKFIETLSQGWFRVGKGSNNPLGSWLSILSYWHTRQVFT